MEMEMETGNDRHNIHTGLELWDFEPAFDILIDQELPIMC